MNRLSALLVLASLAVMAASSAAAAPVTPQSRAFGDWIVSCNNINTCTAYSATEAASVTIVRAAGATGQARLHIDLEEGFDPDARAAIAYDGGRFTPIRLSTTDEGGTIADPALIAPLLAARSAKLRAGGAEAELNLSGMTAALLFIDERQGLLNTPAAFVRKGSQPISTIPAAPALPRIGAVRSVAQSGLPDALPAAMLDQNAVTECLYYEGMEADRRVELADNASKNFSVHRLAGNTLLWLIPCGQSRQYEPLYVAVLSDERGGNIRAAGARSLDGTDITSGFTDYDTERGVLGWGSASGGWGPAHFAYWVWQNDRFVLIRETEATGSTPYWPDTYVTDVAPH